MRISDERKCRMAKSSEAGMKKVIFSVLADPGSVVYVAGTFNEWDTKKHRLTLKNNAFRTSLPLPKGRHEYKFVINDVWCIDPECPEWVPNSMGTLNNVVVVE